MTDVAVSATVTCEAVKAKVGSRSVMVRTVELGAPRVAPPPGGFRVTTTVSLPSGAPSATASTWIVFMVSPAAKVNEAGLRV